MKEEEEWGECVLSGLYHPLFSLFIFFNDGCKKAASNVPSLALGEKGGCVLEFTGAAEYFGGIN